MKSGFGWATCQCGRHKLWLHFPQLFLSVSFVIKLEAMALLADARGERDGVNTTLQDEDTLSLVLTELNLADLAVALGASADTFPRQWWMSKAGVHSLVQQTLR